MNNNNTRSSEERNNIIGPLNHLQNNINQHFNVIQNIADYEIPVQNHIELNLSLSIENQNIENYSNSQIESHNISYPLENFTQFNKSADNKSIHKELNTTNKNTSNSKNNKILINESLINTKNVSQNNNLENKQNIENNKSYKEKFSQYNASGNNKSIYEEINNNESNSNISENLISSEKEKDFPLIKIECIEDHSNSINSSTKTLVELDNILINNIQKNDFYNIMNFFEKFFLFISESLAINKMNQKSIDCLTDKQIDNLQKFIINFDNQIWVKSIEENENIKNESLNKDNSILYEDTILHMLGKEYKVEIDDFFKHRI